MDARPPLLNDRRVYAIGTSLVALTVVVGLGAAFARNDDGAKSFFLGEDSALSRAVAAPLALFKKADAPVAVSRQAAASKTRTAARRDARTRVAKSAVLPLRGPVTIYTDATLKVGDAVMTSRGMRVYAGGQAFPHRDNDFVVVRHADGLSRSVARTLLAMDSVPPG